MLPPGVRGVLLEGGRSAAPVQQQRVAAHGLFWMLGLQRYSQTSLLLVVPWALACTRAMHVMDVQGRHALRMTCDLDPATNPAWATAAAAADGPQPTPTAAAA